MLVTLSGMAMLVKEEQPLNAQCPMRVTLSGITRLRKEEQPLNTFFPMQVTLLEITRLLKDLHLEYLEVIDYQLFAFNTVEKWIGSYLWVYGK